MSAFSIKANEDNIKVVEDFNLPEPKTRELIQMLRVLKIDKDKATKGNRTIKTLFLVGSKDDILSVTLVENVHTYEVMNSDILLFMKSALDSMKVS